MQAKIQRRSPAVRARHGKRLPQFQGETVFGDGDGNVPIFSRPITVTVVQTRQPSPPTLPAISITPTVTVFVPPTTSSSSVSTSSLPSSLTPLGSSLSQSAALSTTSATSTIQPPRPSASANNGNKNDTAAQSNTSAPRGVPIGSIIGIVVAVVLVLIAVVVFLVRRRSVRNRMKMRGGWASKGVTGPSFLWIDPGEKSSVNPYPTTPGQNRIGGASPGNAYTRAQTQGYEPSNLPYIPPPAPPRPPPAHGVDDFDYGPPAPSALGLTIPAALVPGGRGGPAPSTYTSPAPGGYASLSPESATVRSTFIPTLPDELSIATGEVVRIVSAYDDGWALCSNARGEMGMVPLECLDRGVASQAQQEGREYRNLSRVSSLAASPRPYAGTSTRY